MTIDVATPLDCSHVAWVKSLVGLTAISHPAKTIAILPRAPDMAIAEFLDRRPMADFCCPRCEIRPARARSEIERALEKSGLPASVGRQALAADIARLAAAFSLLANASAVKLRLDCVTGDSCRLFHPDNTRVRLVCTYRGPGTEWLPEDAADRAGVGSGDNDGICRDWSRVQALRPFWVGVMKGSRWPGDTNGGLLHRSPPLGEGDWRMFLALDPAE